jgi:hypothetical protein
MRFPKPTALPWRRPRHELLLLALVAGVALAPVQLASAQDTSRLCLTQALTHGNVEVESSCIQDNVDRALRAGRLYSDKAPGMSVLALPAVAAVRMAPPPDWRHRGDLGLWAVRVLGSGVAFLLCALLVGRVAEGLAPGWGGPTLVAYALGTLAAPFAATTFDHVTAGALGFGAFLLAWGRRVELAGLAAGTAVAFEYQTALIAAVLACYVALSGVRPLLRFLVASLPPVALLGAYQWAAFGSPLHTPYRYIANDYTAEQASGFFGIHLPRLHAVHEVIIGNGGLLVISPVVVAAAAGLVLVGVNHRAEAIVCATITILFLLLSFGYFLPYGGLSPGPRFLIPALPFLMVGLAPAFARLPIVTALLTAASVVGMTAITFSWSGGPHYRETIWGELVRVPSQLGSSRLAENLAKTPLAWVVPNRLVATPIVALLAITALGVALTDGWRHPRLGSTAKGRPGTASGR